MAHTHTHTQNVEPMHTSPPSIPTGIQLQLPLYDLYPSPLNLRTVYRGIEELAASMTSQGQLVPLIVRYNPQWQSFCENAIEDATTGKPSEYEIIAGHRRYKAAIHLGWPEIRCDVRELTDEQAQEIIIVEN